MSGPPFGFRSMMIWHSKRKAHQLREGVKGGSHLTWEKKQLPGAGAGQYAWETYGLPVYAQFGFGNMRVTNPLRETFPAQYTFQNVGIVGVPPTSIVQGQFTTQPLMDPTSAQLAGIVIPGAVPNAVSANGIVNGAQVNLNG